MDALTLLLIVDMFNREHVVVDHIDRPAIYQPYTEIYPPIVSTAGSGNPKYRTGCCGSASSTFHPVTGDLSFV